MFRRLATSTRQRGPSQRQEWYPPALRWWSLGLAISFCWLFMVVLEYYQFKSRTDGGVIFATNVNDLPLRRSFVYLYMPTIIAVIFSIFIVWIDNDAKRFEPYRQMSSPDGALGQDSILLHYPFNFIPLVPLQALRKRHWLVFSASLATVVTTFGVVPLQAGIFSTEDIVRTSSQSFSLSQQSMQLSAQEGELALDYTRSAYGILNLNETLPAYMAQNYTLRPFATVDSAKSDSTGSPGTWIAPTTLYSMGLECHGLTPIFGSDVATLDNVTTATPTTSFNITDDCSQGFRNFNNATIGDDLDTNVGHLVPLHASGKIKTYSSIHYGHFSWDDRPFRETPAFPLCSRGDADDYISDGTFFAVFIRNKDRPEDPPPQTFQAIACKPTYYEQDVNATIDSVTKIPVEVVPLSQKRQLPADLFNISAFEQTLASGARTLKYRKDDLPVNVMPRYIEQLSKIDLTAVQPHESERELPPISAMALTSSQHRLEEFLDPIVLGQAYEAAYRLLFVRAMTEVLKSDFSSDTTNVIGEKLERHEAVVLEPLFTHLVVGLLGLVSVLILTLLYMNYRRAATAKGGWLHDDPGSIAAVMAMVADNEPLLRQFENLDCVSTEDMQRKLKHRRYNLNHDDDHSRITEVSLHSELSTQEQESPVAIKTIEPKRPFEFRLIVAVPFIGLFIGLMIALAVLYSKSWYQGLPLPSANPIIQNIVRAYIPTTIATLIEPMWVLINRLLCILQPLEELRSLKASASKSLTLNYTSLPPQLTVIKAARVGHFMLMAVGLMALLANILATAFAGLLYQKDQLVDHSTDFSPPFQSQVVGFNSSVGAAFESPPASEDAWNLNSYQGAIGDEQFLVLDSNYTRNASLPSWTDGSAMYIPFRVSDEDNKREGQDFQAYTQYISSEPNCKPLVFGKDYILSLWSTDPVPAGWLDRVGIHTSTLQVKVPANNGSLVTCIAPLRQGDSFGEQLGASSRDPDLITCRRGRTAADLLTTLAAVEDAPKHEWETCMSAVAIGWMRTSQGNCSDPNLDGSAPTDFEDASGNNTFLMSCQPQITIGDAQVRVDSSGVLQEPAANHRPFSDQSPTALDKYFTSGVASFIAQSNLFVFNGQRSSWHNDSFANEYFHYFMNRAAGNLAFTDPNRPLPTFEAVKGPAEIIYKRLFSTWLSINMDILFVPAANATEQDAIPQINGTYRTIEERIFVSAPLFIVSETILVIYIIVAILVYLRRPGRYLPRMPTSIAAVIALFASSAAVKDLQGTSYMTNKQRERYLEYLDCQYGYGSYIGGDGAVHVGIEKVPFVRYMKEVTFAGSRAETEMRRRSAGKGEKAGVKVEYTALDGGERTVRRDGETLGDVLHTDGQRGSLSYASDRHVG